MSEANLRYGAAGGPGRRIVEEPVSKAEWVPTSVMSGAKKLGASFAGAMRDSAGGMKTNPMAGASRGQRAAQAMGGLAGKATSTPGRTMGTIGGATAIGAMGGAAIGGGAKQPKSASLGAEVARSAKPKYTTTAHAKPRPRFEAGGSAKGARFKIGDKEYNLHRTGDKHPGRKADIHMHDTAQPMFRGSPPARQTTKITPKGGKETDYSDHPARGHVRNAAMDEVLRRARTHPIPSFSPYKTKVTGGSAFEDSSITSTHRGFRKAPGPYVAGGGLVIAGGAVASDRKTNREEDAQEKATAAKAYTRDTSAPPSRQHADPNLVPHRRFDPEARRQRHLGEAAAASAATGVGAGALAVRAQRTANRDVKARNLADREAHNTARRAYKIRQAKRTPSARLSNPGVAPQLREPLSRSLSHSAARRGAVAIGALSGAEALRRRMNDPNSRLNDRHN